MAVSQQDIYRQTRIQTASQIDLIIMLYDGAIRFLSQAEQAVAHKDHERAHNSFVKAQDILVELMVTLDMSAGGGIAENLFRLYDYMLNRLVSANAAKDAAGAREVAGLLQRLRESWIQIRTQNDKVPPQAASGYQG